VQKKLRKTRPACIRMDHGEMVVRKVLLKVAYCV